MGLQKAEPSKGVLPSTPGTRRIRPRRRVPGSGAALIATIALLLAASGCTGSEPELTTESTCLDFLAADRQDQVEAVRSLGSEAGWEGATRGDSLIRVIGSCNAPERDPGETTLGGLFNMYIRLDGG